MRFRIWPFVGNAFCALLVLVGLSVWVTLREVRELDRRTAEVHAVYEKVDNALTSIRGNVYHLSLSVLELPPRSSAAQVSQLRQTISNSRAASAALLQTLMPALTGGGRVQLERLRQELNKYWDSQLASIAVDDSSASPTGTSGNAQHRERILDIAEKLDDLNTANVDRQEEEIGQRAGEFQSFLKRTALLLLLISVAIAGATTYFLSRVEREAGGQKERAERAELELRRLSNQLVKAQEDERKSISRELHDEVGQILTGLRMELGSMQPLNQSGANPAFEERLASVKSLAEDALRSVRNLAMLLRPSMLDDLGLPAALRWQAKEFSRRTGIDAVVRIEGPFDNLPDTHRTCLYRVIQEATTNVARHANAHNVLITLTEERNLLVASVRDDGRGFQKDGFAVRGLGLVGMEERARELRGQVTIESQLGKGTVVKVELPLPEGTIVKAE